MSALKPCGVCGCVSLATDETTELATLRAELAAAREIEQRSRDFLRWVTANGFTDPENMLVCAEWENLRTALGGTP